MRHRTLFLSGADLGRPDGQARCLVNFLERNLAEAGHLPGTRSHPWRQWRGWFWLQGRQINRVMHIKNRVQQDLAGAARRTGIDGSPSERFIKARIRTVDRLTGIKTGAWDAGCAAIVADMHGMPRLVDRAAQAVRALRGWVNGSVGGAPRPGQVQQRTLE